VGGDLSESDGGGGLATSGEDPTECRFECERRANCQFWTHVADWKRNCFLKSVAGEERQLEGAVTGWKGDGCGPKTTTTTTPPPPPPRRRQTSRLEEAQRRREQELADRRRFQQGLLDNTGCKFVNVALLGADLDPDLNGDGINVRSFVECRQACR
jgi:hypothetical protein